MSIATTLMSIINTRNSIYNRIKQFGISITSKTLQAIYNALNTMPNPNKNNINLYWYNREATIPRGYYDGTTSVIAGQQFSTTDSKYVDYSGRVLLGKKYVTSTGGVGVGYASYVGTYPCGGLVESIKFVSFIGGSHINGKFRYYIYFKKGTNINNIYCKEGDIIGHMLVKNPHDGNAVSMAEYEWGDKDTIIQYNYGSCSYLNIIVKEKNSEHLILKFQDTLYPYNDINDNFLEFSLNNNIATTNFVSIECKSIIFYMYINTLGIDFGDSDSDSDY